MVLAQDVVTRNVASTLAGRLLPVPEETLRLQALGAAPKLADRVLTRDAELRLIWEGAPDRYAELRKLWRRYGKPCRNLPNCCLRVRRWIVPAFPGSLDPQLQGPEAMWDWQRYR